MTDVAAPLAHVQLLSFPLPLFARTQEHFDGVKREFALLSLAQRHPEGVQVPARLLALADELRRHDDNPAANVLRDEALERGEETIDLEYDVPAELAPHLLALHRLLDEADSYCVTEQLLSLAMPADMRAFRTWFLTQFTQQIAGLPPQPWESPAV